MLLKNLILKPIALIALFVTTTALAPQQDVYKSIESALAIGSTDRLSEFLYSSVELAIPGQQEEIYSKSQAVIVLQKFFDSNPPGSFTFSHKGNSGSGLRVAIGSYVTTDEVVYRVKIFMKKYDAKYLIHEMEFE